MPVPAEISRENGKKGGRPKSSTNKLTRSLANELIRQGCDGLSVMVENMLFWRGKASEFEELMREQGNRIASLDVKDADANSVAELAAALKEFNKTSAYYLAAREQTQRCAVEVAPYTNPRLQAITIKKQTTKTVVTMNLTPAADDTERTYRGDNIVNLPARSAG